MKKTSETDIYLCGGGQFTGWLLENELIDKLKIKLNPLILGNGIRLFGTSQKAYRLNRTESKTYNDGLTTITYEVLY
ncbi:dihydrofolate reductase family protein [Pseudozobellia sp. WGM2]|uniref:dihydrofolate reductase family protein n=1 Tax=Pseudozobellia sp. WGM2 TaxID=2787625 RepID=UPI001AE07C3A|nr:dihydrofolate reductase family protein [Pseudozobellia sp. WGM2]